MVRYGTGVMDLGPHAATLSGLRGSRHRKRPKPIVTDHADTNMFLSYYCWDGM